MQFYVAEYTVSDSVSSFQSFETFRSSNAQLAFVSFWSLSLK